jgi:hypothetical protein
MKSIFKLLICICVPLASVSQGVNSIHYQSSEILSWATYCDVERGLMDIANPELGYVSSGDPENAIGVYDGTTVSLGDGGIAVLKFENPIRNGEGADFAVFENTFFSPANQDVFAFCEFAFVEVSSDGESFFRFPAISAQQTESQINGFATVDINMYNNLAGMHSAGYGTLFDLQELDGTEGLNTDSITHIRIIDVVGSINQDYGSVDSNGVLINDPYPTAWESGGFDLDAVAVINQRDINSIEVKRHNSLCVYPNPVKDRLNIDCKDKIDEIQIFSLSGKLFFYEVSSKSIDISELPNGIYMLRVLSGNDCFIKKIIKD